MDIDLLTTPDQLQTVRKEWDQWQWFPETDAEFVPLVVESRAAAQGTVVLALRHNGNVQALLVGRAEFVRLNNLPGAVARLQPRLRVLEVLYGGLLGDWRDQNADQFLLALKAGLARGNWQVVRFRMLDLRSPLWARAKLHFPWLCRGCIETPSLHWSLRLPKSCDDLHKGLDSKTRKNLKRHLKLLEDEFRAVSIKRLDQPADLRTIVETTDAILSKTYQQGLDTAWTSPEMVKRVELWLGKGCFRSFFLYAEGKACAYQHILKYRGRAFAMGTGYDPAFHRFGVGRYIQFKALEDLCREREAADLDFGFGDAEYKREICQASQQESDLVLFRFGATGLYGNLTRTLELKAVEAFKRFLKSSGLFASVKRAWRASRRAAPPNSEPK